MMHAEQYQAPLVSDMVDSEVQKLRAELNDLQQIIVQQQQELTMLRARKNTSLRRRLFLHVRKLVLLLVPSLGCPPILDVQPPWNTRRPIYDAPEHDYQGRVLVVSHLFPNLDQPQIGCFVHEQVAGLLGDTVQLCVLSGHPYWLPRTLNPKKLVMALIRYRQLLMQTSTQCYELQGVPVYYAPYLVGVPLWLHGITYRYAVRYVTRGLFREWMPDLIHAHTGYHDGSSARMLKKRYGIPYLLTEHTGPFTAILRTWNMRRDTLGALSEAEKVIMVSSAQQRDVAKHATPRDDKHFMVLPNVTDTKIFYPATHVQPMPGALRISFVGYFEPVKNIPLILGAFAQALHTVPRLSLTLIGARNDAEITSMQAQIDAHGITAQVQIREIQPRHMIAEHMREDMDVLVLASHSETFGCVLTEALCSGKPVIATRCGGPEDIITDARLGMLVANNDLDALANAMIRMANSITEYDSAWIHAHAVSRFSSESLKAKLYALYAPYFHEKAPETTDFAASQIMPTVA